jgi:hypothetical protein
MAAAGSPRSTAAYEGAERHSLTVRSLSPDEASSAPLGDHVGIVLDNFDWMAAMRAADAHDDQPRTSHSKWRNAGFEY